MYPCAVDCAGVLLPVKFTAMDAFQLGPVVISAPRFYAGLGLLVLVLVAEVNARRYRARHAQQHAGSAAGQVPADASWAWNAAFTVVIGARLGFVIENLGYYLQNPLHIFAIWQGGFSPWWGVLAGAAVTAWSFRTRLPALRTLVAPLAAAFFAWLAVPAMLAPVDGSPPEYPAVNLERFEGGAGDLSEYAGQPVVINLWATWCIPCRRELPELARVQQENPDVHVIYVNQGENFPVIQRYLEEDLDAELFNVYLDPRQSLGSGMRSVGLPTTYFFDASGEHVKTQVGEISGPALDREVGRLRAGSD